MKKFLILFVIFLFTTIPAAEAKKIYAPDLSVSSLSLNDGGVTIKNTGTKCSPSSGFDLLVYFKKKDGSYQKTVTHINSVIAPGYSRHFNRTFTNGAKATTGLIRVNPYKKFQEIDYSNNVRYYNMQSKTINTYDVYESGRYWGTSYHSRGSYYYDWDYKLSGASARLPNGGYTPVMSSTNPIANEWFNQVTWKMVSEDIYVNAARIYADYGFGSSFSYVTVSGVPNSYNLSVGLEADHWREEGDYMTVLGMTYNSAKGIWERYMVGHLYCVLIYSNRTGLDGYADLGHCSNITVTIKHMKNRWSWSS